MEKQQENRIKRFASVRQALKIDDFTTAFQLIQKLEPYVGRHKLFSHCMHECRYNAPRLRKMAIELYSLQKTLQQNPMLRYDYIRMTQCACRELDKLTKRVEHHQIASFACLECGNTR